jgi:hypothetical protein
VDTPAGDDDAATAAADGSAPDEAAQEASRLELALPLGGFGVALLALVVGALLLTRRQ